MDKAALLAARKRSREKTVELEDGKKVFITRPPEADWSGLLTGTGDTRTWSVGIEHVRKYVTGWEGFTEADLLGAGVGASDPVPFDPELWDDVCSDSIQWVGKVAEAILRSVVDHITQQDAIAKNSAPA
ncbi:MAG TPA: hypothetical protein VJO99_25890 [Burkholderiaceae bacterium]|nr:hypothetical protein [Burkholderiaceae bacterium]